MYKYKILQNVPYIFVGLTHVLYWYHIESVLRYLFLHFNVCPIDCKTVMVNGMVRRQAHTPINHSNWMTVVSQTDYSGPSSVGHQSVCNPNFCWRLYVVSLFFVASLLVKRFVSFCCVIYIPLSLSTTMWLIYISIWKYRYPCWEIFTGGTRLVTQHIQAIPSQEKYEEVQRKILIEDTYDACLIFASILELLGEHNTALKPIPRQFAETMSKQCDKFVVRYGLSELSAIAFSVFEESKEFQDYQVGCPVPGVEVKIVNSDGHIVKKGERGELYIRSPKQFMGYLNDEEKTSAARTESGWFKSDDSAIITPAGNLIAEGRLSDSIVMTSDGFQSVALLEARLKQHEGIVDAAVLTCVDVQDFKRVCYAAVPKKGSNITEDALKASC